MEMNRTWHNDSNVSTSKPPSECTVNSTNSVSSIILQNGQASNEYSEVVSIVSHSDTDEELKEIENKVYVEGDEGKEEAYKDIQQVFEQLEDEKIWDPLIGLKKENFSDTYTTAKFVPKRPTALPRQVSNGEAKKVPSKGKEETTICFKNSIGSTSTNSGKGSVASIDLESGLKASLSSVPQATTSRITNKAIKINKVSETVNSPRKSVMVELIMEENMKRKQEETEQKRKDSGQDLKSIVARTVSGLSQAGSPKIVTSNVNAFGLNRLGSSLSSAGEHGGSLSHDSRQPQLTRQDELIQELANPDSKKNKHEEFGFDNDGHKGQDDKTVFKIQYKKPRWPHQSTLDKMVDRLYRVKTLIIDESEVNSLRDISSLLPSLIVLSVKSCGLKTLDGTFAFPNLQKLYASNNLLTHPAQCSFLTELQELDLSGNPIDSIEGFHYLSVLNFLRVIKLYDTKVSENKGFHMDLRRLIPSLRDIYPKVKSQHFDFDLDYDSLEEDYKLLGKTMEEIAQEQDDTKTIPNLSKPESIVSSARNLCDQNPLNPLRDTMSSVSTVEKDVLKTNLNNSESDTDTKNEPDLRNLEHLYEYVSAAGKSDADSLHCNTNRSITSNDFDSMKCNSSHWSTIDGELLDEESDFDDSQFQLDDAGDKAM